MDPDAAARDMVTLARRAIAAGEVGQALDSEDALRLAELVIALAEWRARDGFEPLWSRALGQP